MLTLHFPVIKSKNSSSETTFPWVNVWKRWEDLLDLNLEPTEIAKRKQYYGDDFIEAQNIIKSKVSKDDYDFMNYVWSKSDCTQFAHISGK